MADLKTTAEERARLHKSAQFNMWLPGSATLTMQALDDLDTLLRENAKLRAVAEAAKFVCSRRRGSMLPQAIDALRRALYALGEP